MPELVPITISRLLSLIAWICEHPGTSLDELAAHFGRTRRQITRDIEAIGSVGDSLPGQSFEIDWDLYSTQERLVVHSNMGIALPPRLTAREATAILVGLEALAPSLDEDLRARIPKAACAVRALVGAEETDGAGEGGPLLLSEGADSAPEVLDVLAEAIRARRPVSFTYTRADGARAERRVDPWGLRFEGGGWMLHGLCHDAREERVFAVRRIETPVLDDGSFTRPSAPGDDPAPRVELEVGPGGRWAGEEYSDSDPEAVDGGFRMRIPVWNRAWIETLLIDLAPHLLSAPDDLKRGAGDRARRMRAAWEEHARKDKP